LYPYPTEVPVKEVIDLVLLALKGQGDPKETSHAVWQLIGFGLSKWDVHSPVVTTQVVGAEETTTILETTATVDLPWSLILPVLLALLEKLLKK
jgi:hypothetical protein